VPAGGGASELEVRHVRADDEEEDAHGGEEQQHRRALGLRERAVVVVEADAHLRVRVGVGLLQPACDRRHLLAGPGHRHLGTAPRHDAQEVGAAQLDELLGLEPQGEPELHVARGEEEVRGHDPDDGIGLAGELDLASDGRGVATELRLPEAVAEDGHAILSLVGLLFRERAARARGDTEHVEEVSRRVHRLQPLRLALAGEEDVVADVSRHPREGRARLPPVREVRGGGVDAGPALEGVRLGDPDEAAGVGVGERAQEHRLGHCEHRGGGAHPHA
jgi:hypothetical protein